VPRKQLDCGQAPHCRRWIKTSNQPTEQRSMRSSAVG
jgi:hypothetical protein